MQICIFSIYKKLIFFFFYIPSIKNLRRKRYILEKNSKLYHKVKLNFDKPTYLIILIHNIEKDDRK